MNVSKSRRMQTIDALLDGYGSLSVTRLLEPLAPEFHHQTLPESLGMPVRDRAGFAKHAAGIFGLFEAFRMVPRTVIDDAQAGVVAVEAQMLGTLKWGGGEWRNECVLMVRLTDDGSQVLDIREFVDSAKAVEMARAHAPEHFGAGDDGVSGWGLLDSDWWIHFGAVAIITFGLRQILR
ncbi:hypothetical protein F4861DRAFT_364460 [Xylaria intraflava]|nr:hypothetical protein F4861DRAFT_364460 [Xylaria intraflava]